MDSNKFEQVTRPRGIIMSPNILDLLSGAAKTAPDKGLYFYRPGSALSPKFLTYNELFVKAKVGIDIFSSSR